ncbi:MAG TPA: peptidylprolyl isomerase [Cyclobacteriaceae bacterium]|jgi:peptidyl-prolyl cis-trans isomerase B (cyclophilin B)|nr:peptidylprolyl isomerase [Cyclobacteriaceae bacterium]
MRYQLPALILLVILGCASPKTFRTLTPSEKETVERYRKQVNSKDGNYHVLIMTNEGNMVVKLYNETPLHRDNFIKLVKSGFYDSLMFHRVINNFMIQGGDPNSKHAKPGQSLGDGDAPGDRIPAEFRTEQGLYHKRGALAAARDGNPAKASSNCQFYIVQRPVWKSDELEKTIAQRQLKLNDAQKKIYTTVGGTPHLDGGYTVFGELEQGFEALDRIATTSKNASDRPDVDVRMKMFVLSEPKKK